MKTKWMYMSAGLLVMIALTGYFTRTLWMKPTQEASTQMKEQRVMQGDLKIDQVADGNITLPLYNVDFEVNGTLARIAVKSGQMVKKGDILAELDSDTYTQAISKAELSRKKAETSLANVQQQTSLDNVTGKQKVEELQLDYEKSKTDQNAQIATEEQKVHDLQTQFKKLEQEYTTMSKLADAYPKNDIESKRLDYENAKKAYESGLAHYKMVKVQAEEAINKAKVSYENQKKQYAMTSGTAGQVATARVEVESAQNDLATAQTNLNKTVLRAPIDGKVVYISKKVGEQTGPVQDDGSTTTVDTKHFIVLADSGTVQVKSNVTESDIKNITLGQPVEVTVDANEGEAIRGKVTAINSLPKVDSNGVVTYEVTADLTGAGDTLKEGMSAVVSFILKEKKNVLYVPNKAVKAENGKQYVQVKQPDGTVAKKYVQGGMTDGENMEVVSGLSRNDIVLVKEGKK